MWNAVTIVFIIIPVIPFVVVLIPVCVMSWCAGGDIGREMGKEWELFRLMHPQATRSEGGARPEGVGVALTPKNRDQH